MKIRPMHAIDFYKSGHIFQYEPGTEAVYSNLTARSSKHALKLKGIFDDKVVVFGLQGFIQWFLIDAFNAEFFHQPREKVVSEYKRRMDLGLGVDSVTCEHIGALHDTGYLPLRIKALPEGTRVNMRIPFVTTTNTQPEFFWLTNYLEDVLSNETWKTVTSATTAWQYRKLLDLYADMTGSSKEFVMWQGHDFSFRGMSGMHDGAKSGAGHLLSFFGTDTVLSLDYLEDYYLGADTFLGGSVPATEHSVMCMGGDAGELETIKRLITQTYPSGVVSIVSDTWDFWNVITVTAATLKPEILARKENALGQAKVVFRPDSGDPADIICGLDSRLEQDYAPIPDSAIEAELKGAVECLWDIFGGTINDAGYKELNPRVGLIYGDSITLERAENILERLKRKGFASSNIVFGIGSFTYQYQTRDAFGFAIKATYGEIGGNGRALFKDPKTGDGMKKSAQGLLRVEREGDNFILFENQTWEQERMGELQTVFEDGVAKNIQSVAEIRERLHPTE